MKKTDKTTMSPTSGCKRLQDERNQLLNIGGSDVPDNLLRGLLNCLSNCKRSSQSSKLLGSDVPDNLLQTLFDRLTTDCGCSGSSNHSSSPQLPPLVIGNTDETDFSYVYHGPQLAAGQILQGVDIQQFVSDFQATQTNTQPGRLELLSQQPNISIQLFASGMIS